MEKTVQSSGKKSFGRILRQRQGFRNAFLIALAVFVLRAVGSLLFRTFPTLIIDENLYTSLAKGLLKDFSISYRDQPIDYPYLLYPLTLCPVYLLERLLGGDIYRWIQMFNALLMALSVIPAYLFAEKFTGDEKKALICAGIWALMPDGVLSGYLLCESLIWLLTAWMLYFAWGAFRELSKHGRAGRDGILTGVFAFLLFITKPGAVAVPAVLCAAMLVIALKQKKGGILSALMPVLTAAVLIGVWYGLYFLFFNQTKTGMLGLYVKQTKGWTVDNIPVMLEAIPLSVFMAAFALCGIFLVLPLCGWKEYTLEQRRFILPLLLGMLAVLAGTAVFVTPYQWDRGAGNIPLHLRYVSMYLPVLIVFTLTLPEHGKLKRHGGKGPSPSGFSANKLFYILMIVFIVLCVFPGVRAGVVEGDNTPADSVTLAAFHINARNNGAVEGTIETAFVALTAAYLVFYFYEAGRSKKLIRLAVIFLTAAMLFNNLCAYRNANARYPDSIREDAMEIKAITKELEEEPLGVTQIYYDNIYTYWMECHLDRAMQQVTNQQFAVDLYTNGGVFRPVVPVDQSPNKNCHETIDTGTFVLGMFVREHMELVPEADVTVTKNGHFAVVKVPRGSRIADTMLDGVNDNTMNEELTGRLFVFDPARINCEQLQFTFTASGDGQMEIDGQVIPMDAQAREYTLYLKPARCIDIKVTGGDVAVTSYSTAPVGAAR